jgi:hypothetical protein
LQFFCRPYIFAEKGKKNVKKEKIPISSSFPFPYATTPPRRVVG